MIPGPLSLMDQIRDLGRRIKDLETRRFRLSDTGWVDLTIADGFTYHTSQARLKDGTVRLRGSITRDAGAFTTTTETVAQLPEGMVPPVYSRFATPLYASASAGTLIITIGVGSRDVRCAAAGASSDTLYLDPVWFDID